MPEGSSEAIGTGRCQGTRAALPSSDLTDGEWALVGSLIPSAGARGISYDHASPKQRRHGLG